MCLSNSAVWSLFCKAVNIARPMPGYLYQRKSGELQWLRQHPAPEGGKGLSITCKAPGHQQHVVVTSEGWLHVAMCWFEGVTGITYTVQPPSALRLAVSTSPPALQHGTKHPPGALLGCLAKQGETCLALLDWASLNKPVCDSQWYTSMKQNRSKPASRSLHSETGSVLPPVKPPCALPQHLQSI